MKTILILFILIWLVKPGFSLTYPVSLKSVGSSLNTSFLNVGSDTTQKYIPMLGDSNKWYVLKYPLTEIYATIGNKTINDTLYKIFNWVTGSSGGYYIVGYLREDTIQKRIYIRSVGNINIPNGIEYILYDFSLKKGDSILLHNVVGSYVETLGYYKVDSIGTFKTLIDGRNMFFLIHKFNASPVYYEFPVWVEGIGSVGNPLYSGLTPSEYEQELSCFFKDNQLIYQSQKSIEFGGCDLYLIIDNSIKNKMQPMVIPNPVTDISFLKIPSDGIYYIKIFDVLGRTVLYKEITDGFPIKNSDYRQGIYIFRLLKNNQFYSSGKFIVK